MQRVLFEHLFIFDNFEKSIYSVSVIFIKGSSPTHVFQNISQSFVAAISKHPDEKFGSVLGR